MVEAFLPEQVDTETFPALVKLGEVELATRSWQWSFVSGADSPEMRLIVDNLVDEKLQSLDNPVRLFCRGAKLNDRDAVTFEHEQVYLLERQRISPWEVRWILADQRRLFRDVLVGGRFNVTRRANELDSAGQPDALGIFETLNTIRRYRYVPPTLRDEFADPPRFARIPPGGDVRQAQGVVWTAYEVVRWLLTRGYRAGGTTERIELEIDSGVKDNGYVEEDVVFGAAGERFPTALRRFLNLARLGLFVAPSGKWVLYDLAAAPITAKVGGYEGAGTLAKEDLSRVRPDPFVWRCGTLHEVLIHQPDEDTAARNPSLNDLLTRPENVGVLPTAIEVNGVRYERGEYLKISDLIAAYNAVGWPTGRDLTIGRLRKNYLGRQALYRDFCLQSNGRFDIEAVARMESLRNAYRRVWRLPQPLLDVITDWQPVRVARLSAVTGQRMPSPVWCDYTALPAGKVKIPIGQAGDFRQSTPASHPTNLSTLDVSDPAPFSISVIDKDLGIFSIDTNTVDPSGRVSLFFLGRLEDQVDMAFSKLITQGTFETANLVEDFPFSTIISVRFAPPEGGPSGYAIKARATEFGVKDAKGPRYESRETREVARYRWLPGSTEIVESDNGHAQVSGAELMNKAALTALARASGQRVYWSFADRWIGRFERPRYEADVDRPRGNARTVTVRFQDGRLTTVYVLPEGSPPPDMYELLPAAVRQEQYRQISRVT